MLVVATMIDDLSGGCSGDHSSYGGNGHDDGGGVMMSLRYFRTSWIKYLRYLMFYLVNLTKILSLNEVLI